MRKGILELAVAMAAVAAAQNADWPKIEVVSRACLPALADRVVVVFVEKTSTLPQSPSRTH